MYLRTSLFMLLSLSIFSSSILCGQDEILDSYPALKERVQKKLAEVKRGRGKHVIYGRVVLEGNEDPIYIKSQMLILPGGYFSDTVKDLERPIGFRKHQYHPLDYSLEGKTGDLINLGVIRLKRLPPEEYVPLTGKVLLEDSSDFANVTVSLHPGNGPVNTPSNGTEPRPKWPAPIHVDMNEDGSIYAKEFSPIKYYCKIEHPGYVKFAEYIHFEAETGVDLGVVKLEKEKHFTLRYMTSPTGTFDIADIKIAKLKAGDTWKATPDIYGYDLKFAQNEGKILFDASYHPCLIADLGSDSIEESLPVDPSKANQSVRDYEVKDGHLYLVYQRFWKRYILMKFEID